MQTLLDTSPREILPREGVEMWSGQFVKAWSETMGVLALSSGESELAAVSEGSNRSHGTAVNFQRLLFVRPCGT